MDLSQNLETPLLEKGNQRFGITKDELAYYPPFLLLSKWSSTLENYLSWKILKAREAIFNFENWKAPPDLCLS